jgi:hypothetical protein
MTLKEDYNDVRGCLGRVQAAEMAEVQRRVVNLLLRAGTQHRSVVALRLPISPVGVEVVDDRVMHRLVSFDPLAVRLAKVIDNGPRPWGTTTSVCIRARVNTR